MLHLIQFLLDAPKSEHAPVFQDAAWTLLARALALLQSADEANGHQKVRAGQGTDQLDKL